MAKALNVSLAVTANTSQAKQQLQQLQQSLQQLTTSSANLKIGLSADEIQKASQAALELSAHLKTATNVNTGTLDFTKLNSSIRSSGQSLEEYGRQLMTLGPRGKQAFMQLAQSVAKSEIPIKRLSSLLGNFGTVLANTVRWQLSSSMIHGFMGAIQTAYGYAQDLNKSLNNIQIVTQMSDTQMSKFAVTANKAAKALSTTTTSYTDAALIYYQQGIRDEKEIAQRTDATIKMANVTGQSAQKVSDQMTAIWNNFAKGGENLEYYADVITALGAATASSSEEISKGLEKFASIADTVGLSYENATAALATITATTRQSADTVGTGLRTLFSRLQSLSLGETLEDGVNLTKYSKALRTVGVEVLDATGNLRRMDDILLDLGDKWDTLTKAQQTALAQTVGGVRQYTTLVALMDNIDFYKENLEVAKNSEGTLQRQQEIYEKSWAAAAKRVRASAESIYSNLIDDEFFTKLTDNFAKFLDILNNVITGLGGMKGILLSLGGALTATFSDKAAAGLYKFGVGVRDLFTSPKALAAKRDAFVANAAGIYAGLPIDSKTGYIQGAILDKKTGRLDMTGVSMSASQTQMYNSMASQLAIQQAYSKNASFMTPEQQQAARIAMDQYTNASIAATQAREAAIRNDSARRDARSSMISGARNEILTNAAYSVGSKKPGETDKAYQARFQTESRRFEQDSYADITRMTRNFEQTEQARTSRIHALEKISSGSTDISKLSAGELKTLRRQLQVSENVDLTDKIIVDQLIDQEIQARAEARDQFSSEMRDNYGVSKERIDKYISSIAMQAEGRIKEKETRKEEKQAKENAEDLVKKQSLGMKAAQNITNVAGGAMSALAAQQGFESFTSTIEQANAGLITTKEAATQGVSAVASMAINGARAFQSFSAALGPIGGAIATVATIALPYLIDAFDNAYETDKEKMERLNNQVEMAQNDLTQARQEYKDIFNDFNGYDKVLEGLNKMTVGTREFKDAIREANTEAEALIEKYNLSESDYFTDRNGAIHFRAGLEDELADKKDQEIAQKEQQVEIAEFNRDLNQLRQDRKQLDSAKSKAQAEYDQAHSNSNGNYWGNEADREAYIKANTSKFIDDKLAQQYGYTDAVAMTNAYFNDNAGLNAQMQAKSGIAKQYADVLEAQAKANDGKISDLEELSNQALLNEFDAFDESQFRLKRDAENIFQGEKDYVEYAGERINIGDANDRKVNTERREKAYKAQLETIYGAQQAEEMYNELIESASYQGLTEKQKQQKLNGLLEQQEIQKMVEDAAKDNQKILESVDISKYEGFKGKKGKDLISTSQEVFKNYVQDEDGTWRNKSTNEVLSTEEQTRLNAEKNLADAIAQQWGDSAANLQQVLMAQTNLNATQADIESMAKDFSIEDLNTLSTYTNMFGQMFGADTAGYIFAELTNEMKSGGSDLLDALDSIDWSDSNIDNLFSLRSAIDNLGENQPELKQQLRNTASLIYDSIGGSAGLLEELYGSDGFADTLENLKETFEETGEISADAILSAAKGCKQLSKFLDITDVNAQGLADVLESIEIGDIGIDQVTDGLLQAMSAAGALDANLSQVYQHIDNFQLDRSISDVGKFYKGLADQIEDSQGAGMLLDKPLLQSWGELFGQDSLNAYKDWARNATDRKNWTPEQISDDFNEQFAAEIAAMQSTQERGDLSGMFKYTFNKNFDGGQVIADINGVSTALMHFDETTGQVVTDNDEAFQQMFASQADFIDYLANNLNVPQDMAEAMAAQFAAADPWAHDAWGLQAAEEGFQKLLDSVNNGTDLSIDALRAFYNQYKEFFNDKSFDDFVKRFTEGMTDVSGSLINLGKDFNYAEADLTKLNKAMGNDPGESTLAEYLDKNAGRRTYIAAGSDDDGSWGSSTVDNPTRGKARDVNQLQAAYMKLGFTAQQANALIAESLQAAAEGSDKAIDGVDKLTGSYRTANEGLQEFSTTDEAYLKWVGEQYGEAAKATAQYSAEYALAYQDAMNKKAQTEVDAGIYAEAFANALTDVPINFNADNLASVVATAQASAGEVTIPVKWGDPGPLPDGTQTASGYNNAKGFAGGKHSNGQYEGLADVGELGPELFIHDGQPYLAGVHGRTRAYVHKDDSIYTAAETRQILEENPSLQDIPGFSVGYNRVTWGKKGSNATASNAKKSNYEPERYHLITRQLKDLQREYNRLSKVKDNAYGTNKLEAIQAEVDATNDLIEGQKALIREAEDYVKIDAERLKGMLAAGEFQIDENGNLKNFEELQDKYRRAAEENKDEHAQGVWKALQQYEETLDKLQEANVEMQDLLYQEMELHLEKITTKAELKIDFDEREIKLLDHYIKRIDDNIYHTAEVLALTEQKLGNIASKITTTKEAIDDIFAELSDSQGNRITKEDGSNYTLEDWLALSNEERDLLDINDNFGKQLEEYMDNLLDYIEELEEFKTKGVEEFADAFSELNDNVRSSIDLFDHYNSLLSSLKNITDLQGVKLSAEMRAALKEIDAAMFGNTQNNIDAERENYRRLNASVAELRQKVVETTDETLKKQWEEQLKTAEDELRTSQSNLLSLWETGLQQAKDMFESALDEAATNYESTIAGMYGTTDELQKAWDQQKKNDEFYVKDYEKYYQISKLQRSITKDLDAAARSGNKQNQGLKKLFDDLNAARENGVELSAYDLDIFAKRYEYEKALMELEDARNNKSEVRLQRDANGNWGYVYTSAADDDDLIAKQQAVDDKFYELQKATQERVASLSDDMMSEITGVGRRLQELRSSGASQETIDAYLEQERKYLENYRKGLAQALADAGMTEEEAKLRYGEEGFDILDQFSETLLSAITGGNETLDDFFARVGAAMEGTNDEMAQAAGTYNDNMKAINDWFNESGEDLATVIKGFTSVISEESDGNLIGSKEQIQNAKDTFDEILKVATNFEQKFLEIYQPIINANEQLVADLLKALHALNAEEYKGPGRSSNPDTRISDLIQMDTGGYTSSWGSSGRLAMLHEKELVLNKDDTANFLNATQILRTIDLQTKAFSNGFGSMIIPWISDMAQQTLDQNVHIEASFPNVTDHNEIELAFDNLVNKASQYANRKNMSSMTFQDMYTSKF